MKLFKLSVLAGFQAVACHAELVSASPTYLSGDSKMPKQVRHDTKSILFHKEAV